MQIMIGNSIQLGMYRLHTNSLTSEGHIFKANHYAIADFGGNVYMLETNSKSMIPQPR